MFISRVEMPWDEVRNPYNLHRLIWRLFPGQEREPVSSDNSRRFGFLYRMEQWSTGRPARALVQSIQAPQSASGLAVLGIRAFDPQPVAGQALAFVLTANPIKSVVDEHIDAKPGKTSSHVRVPLLKEDEQRAWLRRKLAGAAELAEFTVIRHPPSYFRKGNRAGKLVTVSYEGALRVTDAEALRQLLMQGVGPAKAFGCGLLLVRQDR